MKKRNRKIEPIVDDSQQKNTKSRRRKNLMKKSYELSVLCGLEVHLIIYDSKYDKMIEYSSNQNFTHDKIHKLINPPENSTGIECVNKLKRTCIHSQNFLRPLMNCNSVKLDAKKDCQPVDKMIRGLDDICDILKKDNLKS